MTEPRILIIDADSTRRADTKKYLHELSNVGIEECDNGLDALQLLRTNQFDLVVSDIDLQNMDVWRLTRLIRSDMLCSKANTRIIILSTTYSDRIAEATAKEFEVDQFLPLSQIQNLPKLAMELLKNNEQQLSKTRILVVEDYQDTADLIYRVLHKRYDITIAEDGEAGLEAWRAQRHDICLLYTSPSPRDIS